MRERCAYCKGLFEPKTWFFYPHGGTQILSEKKYSKQNKLCSVCDVDFISLKELFTKNADRTKSIYTLE